MDLVEVFSDTKSRYLTDEKLKQAAANTRAGGKLYLEGEKIDFRAQKKYDTKILVSKKRSFEAAAAYKGERVAVLNFANSISPGGGVLYGARAQEESLCRISTLYSALTETRMLEGFYKPHFDVGTDAANDDIIYSPDVVVFKDDVSLEPLDEKDWYKVDVITCAAPDLNEFPLSDEEVSRLHESRFRRILEVAAVNDCTVTILGAFGCGAFLNPPEIVARAAKSAVDEYSGVFKTIEFAVSCFRDWTNYDVFKKIFS